MLAGYCGLVKVQDEDLVRAEAQQQHAAAPPHTKQQQHAAPPPPAWPPQHRRRPSGAPSAGSAGTRTPPGGASPRAGSASSSPLKPGPVSAPADAAAAADQAVQQLQLGRLREAQALLHRALRRCPLTDIQLARRICDLLLEAEREQQQTPTHSREPSDAATDAGADAASWAAGGLGQAGGEAGSGDAAGLLQAAVDAMAAGQVRRAEAALLQALAACPPDQRALRRRVEMYLQLVQCKR